MKEIEIRDIKKEDIDEVISFFEEHTYRKLSHEKILASVEKYSCCLAYINARLIGFSYTNRFAPDILELSNIFVHPEYRSRGFGAMMLRKIEEKAIKKYTGLILVNSLLYDNGFGKKFATNFYIENGYSEIAQTEFSKIFFKIL